MDNSVYLLKVNLFHRRKMMRKFLRLVLLVSMLVMMIAAIGATQAQDNKLATVLNMPKEIAGGRPVTFTITNMPPETDTAAHQAWVDQANRFQALYPNVTVQGLEYTYAADSFAALVAGNQVPTIFQVYMTEPTKYIDSGVAADITSIF